VRRRRPAVRPGDDYEERHAIIKEYGAYMDELEGILAETAPESDLRFVLGHRVGIERAIDIAKRRRADVKALLI
jgi:hypothetical protein